MRSWALGLTIRSLVVLLSFFPRLFLGSAHLLTSLLGMFASLHRGWPTSQRLTYFRPVLGTPWSQLLSPPGVLPKEDHLLCRVCCLQVRGQVPPDRDET